MRLVSFSGFALILSAVCFIGCKKDCPDHKIVVDAGVTQQVQLPASSTTLTGTVTSGGTASDTYLWTLVSGPSVPQIVNNKSLTTNINNLVVGTYLFQFQATNSYGETGLDTTSIVVLPVLIASPLILKPANNQYEGYFASHVPTSWSTGSSQILVEAWTISGAEFHLRCALKFDYTGLPAGAVIDDAKLYLYSDPNPLNGDKIKAQDGTTNSFHIRRITSSFVLPNPFTWNSQPVSVTTNQVIVPQSASSSESIVADVTALVKDQLTSGNNGFYMGLQNEVIYNIRQFASSYAANASLHPKLILTFH